MVELRKSESGTLECRADKTADWVAVRLCPCLPLTRPGEYLGLCAVEGEEEVAFVKSPGDLDAGSREALEGALAEAGFLMEVTRIESIEDGQALREWRVETKRGTRRFLTQLDSWPRELEGGGILIEDISEDLYLVSDPKKLDAESRERLWYYVG